MQRTISAMVGKGSVNHNSRKFKAANVDAERSHLNIEYCNENIRDVYHKLFDTAQEEYNARQTRADRRIKDYYEKIRSGKQEKPFHELIMQIGDMKTMSATGEYAELARDILDEYFQGFQERNPNLYVFSAHLHMDEATPHLHLDYIPVAHGYKKGLRTRNSLTKALQEMGIAGEIIPTPGHSDDSISLCLDDGSFFVGDLNPLYELEMHRGTMIADSWERLLARHPKTIYYGHARIAKMDLPEEQQDAGREYALVKRIMRYTDKGYSAERIQQKTGAPIDWIRDAMRMYLTHTNISVQGILDRMEIRGR